MPTRREFLKIAALAGGGLLLPFKIDLSRVSARVLAAMMPSLDPTGMSKYVDGLVIPPAMPRTTKVKVKGAKNIDYYEIAVREFYQQILPTGMPATKVWSYGSINHPASFNYPAFTIEAKVNKPVRVKWINDLKDTNGNFLPHLLPVDPTLHWANPPGGIMQRDSRPHFMETPGPYTGPVPIVTHVHGAHVGEESDGYAEAWFLPAANDNPAGYAVTGTFYDWFKSKAESLYGPWQPGTAVFQYPNDQRATTLWYHDHTLGMTRLNVYAGPAGFYLLRGGRSDLPAGVLPGPAPALGDPPGVKYYEIPIAIQDRSFNSDGSLFFPDTREFFDGIAGPYIPVSDVSPIWNPEFFGNAMVVNGKTWPVLNVEQRRYRFRFLNGCNSRFLILKMVTHDPTARPGVAALPFWQIGSEGGFLPAPVGLDALLIGLAERADVIVDFTSLPVGTEVYLINEGPDEPFGGGIPGVDFDWANPETTGQVMKFVVSSPAQTPDTSADPSIPGALVLPAITPLAPTFTRQVSLNEMMSMYPGFDGPVEALLGTVDLSDPANPVGVHLHWSDDFSENPAVGAIETWEIFNFTADAHPIHLHQVMFQVVNRELIGGGGLRPPEIWETGEKDTVIAYPGEITRIKARFDLPGLYVWHCHIVDHEDNEMMRPYHVGPVPAGLPHPRNSHPM
jgi:bilirubin oxidase